MSTVERQDLNPVTIAEVAASFMLNLPDEPAITDTDRQILRGLDERSTTLGFVDIPYRVEAARAVSLPGDFLTTHRGVTPLRMFNFFDVAFEGEFLCYEKVILPETYGPFSINALCALFRKTRLLPDRDPLMPRHVFATPVTAVRSITRL